MTDRASPTSWRAAVLCSALSLAAAAQSTAGAAPPLERMLESAGITHAVPSPDGERVAYVVARDHPENGMSARLFVASADGAAVRRFTHDPSPVTSPRWSPDGRWLAYLQGRHGDTVTLTMMPADGGGPRRISPPGTSVEAFQWAPVGDALAFLSRGPAAPDTDGWSADSPAIVVGPPTSRRHLWLVRLDAAANPGQPLRLTPDPYHVSTRGDALAFDWSPDGREIAFTHTRSPAPDDWKSADISVVDVTSGRIRTFQQSNAAEFAPRYSPDGDQLAFNVTVYPPSAVGQWRVGLAHRDGSGLKLLAATPDEQPRLVGWITDRMLLVQEPFRTVTALWKLPSDGGEPRRFDDGESVLTAVTLNEPATRLAFATMNERTPQEAAITGLRRFRPVTVSAANQGLAETPGVSTRPLSWTSGDGQEVEGLLTLPPRPRDGMRHPLLLLIQDDPAGVATRDYPGQSRGLQPLTILAGRGVAVLRVNQRGASGYGHGFRAAAPDVWGGTDYDDLMSGVDHAIASGIADPDRLAVMGWGHGGFMAGRMVTRTHRFRAAILGAPMTDLVQVRTVSASSAFLPDYLGGEPWQRPDAYRDRSILLDAHRVTTPVLILHGGSDRRVPPAQGLALHRMLEMQGLETRMLLYPEAPHHLRAPAQRLHAVGEILAWLERHLGVP